MAAHDDPAAAAAAGAPTHALCPSPLPAWVSGTANAAERAWLTGTADGILALAARQNDEALAKAALAAGASPNGRAPHERGLGFTPLMYAARYNSDRVAKLLLADPRTDLNAVDATKQTAGKIAKAHNSYLVTPSLNAANATQALRLAITNGDAGTVASTFATDRYLVNQPNDQGLTPAMIMAQSGTTRALVRVLSAFGANLLAVSPADKVVPQYATDTDDRDAIWFNALRPFCETGNLDQLNTALRLGSPAQIINARDLDGSSLLMIAASARTVSTLLPAMLAAGADLFATSDDGEMAISRATTDSDRQLLANHMLLAACHAGDLEKTELALGAHADPNCEDQRGYTPAMLAAQSGNASTLIRPLAEAGAQLLKVSPEGKSAADFVAKDVDRSFVWYQALKPACEAGDLHTLQAAVRIGANLNARDDTGNTLLQVCATAGTLSKVLPLFVAAGVDLAAASNGLTAVEVARDGDRRLLADQMLLRACKDGDARVVQMSLDQGANVNAVDAEGLTTSMLMAKHGHTRTLVAKLAEKGADFLLQAGGKRASDFAVDAVERLIIWHYALFVACAAGDAARAKAIIAAGGHANARNENGLTVLMRNAQTGTVDKVLPILIELHADLFATNELNHSAVEMCVSNTDRLHLADQMLFQACRSGNCEKVTQAITAGANANAVDEFVSKGLTVAMVVAVEGKAKTAGLLKLLSAAGAHLLATAPDGRALPLMATDEAGRNLLWFHALRPCCVAGDAETLKSAIHSGANVNARDERGRTLLSVCGSSGTCASLLEILVEAKVDLFAKSNGELAVDVARPTDRHLIADQMLLHGCTTGNLDNVQLAITKGANVNVLSKAGHTPAMVMAVNGNSARLGAVLVNAGADLLAITAAGKRAADLVQSPEEAECLWHYGLRQACLSGNAEKAKAIVNVSRNADARDEDGLTPLMWFSKSGDLRAVLGILLQLPMDLYAVSQGGQMAVELCSDPEDRRALATVMLHRACSAGKLDLVQRAIANTADVNGLDERGYTPAMIMAETGHTAGIIDVLLKANADLFAKTPDGRPVAMLASQPWRDHIWFCALKPACILGEATRLKNGLAAGANVNARDEESKRTLLMVSAEHGTIKRLLTVFVEAGADLFAADKIGRLAVEHASVYADGQLLANSMMFMACRRGDLSQLSIAFTFGADASVPDDHGLTAAMVMAQAGYTKTLIARLAEAGADFSATASGRAVASFAGSVTDQDLIWSYVLRPACVNGDVHALKVLLTGDAPVNARNGQEQSPLLVCAAAGQCSKPMLDALVFAGANLFAIDAAKHTALDVCTNDAQRKAIASHMLLVECGGGPSVETDHGRSYSGPLSRVMLALQAGADVETENVDGLTPVMCMVASGRTAQRVTDASGETKVLARVLAEHCADFFRVADGKRAVDLAGDDATAAELVWHYALLQACQSGDLQAVQSALDAGAHINAHDENDHSLLMVAAASAGALPVLMPLFVHNGADLFARDAGGKEALDHAVDQDNKLVLANAILLHACRHGDVANATRALDSGANVNVSDKSGDSPMELARSSTHAAELIALLVQHGAVDPVATDAHSVASAGSDLEVVLSIETAAPPTRRPATPPSPMVLRSQQPAPAPVAATPAPAAAVKPQVSAPKPVGVKATPVAATSLELARSPSDASEDDFDDVDLSTQAPSKPTAAGAKASKPAVSGAKTLPAATVARSSVSKFAASPDDDESESPSPAPAPAPVPVKLTAAKTLPATSTKATAATAQAAAPAPAPATAASSAKVTVAATVVPAASTKAAAAAPAASSSKVIPTPVTAKVHVDVAEEVAEPSVDSPTLSGKPDASSMVSPTGDAPIDETADDAEAELDALLAEELGITTDESDAEHKRTESKASDSSSASPAPPVSPQVMSDSVAEASAAGAEAEAKLEDATPVGNVKVRSGVVPAIASISAAIWAVEAGDPDATQLLHAANATCSVVSRLVPHIGSALGSALSVLLALYLECDPAKSPRHNHQQQQEMIKSGLIHLLGHLSQIPSARPALVERAAPVLPGLVNALTEMLTSMQKQNQLSFVSGAVQGASYRLKYVTLMNQAHQAVRDLLVALGFNIEQEHEFEAMDEDQLLVTLAGMGTSAQMALASDATLPKDSVTWDSKPLAANTLSSVYKGTYRDRPVAIKFLNISAPALKDLCRLASLLKHVHHRNLVEFYGLIPGPRAVGLVLEYVSGNSMETALASAELSWPFRVRVAHHIARGMAYLHGMGIVHADLKCANVLLDLSEGRTLPRAVVTGFGLNRVKGRFIAAAVGGGTTSATGSLQWMAPELLSDMAAKPTQQSDIWAFGMLLRELALCDFPFGGDMDPSRVIAFILQNKLPAVPSSTGCPSWIRNLIEKCNNVRPSKRPTFESIVTVFDKYTAQQKKKKSKGK